MTSKDKLRREIASLEEEVGRLRMDNFIWRNRCRIRSDARDDAHEHAHLWKEVARTLLRQRNDWRTDARREEYRADLLGRAHRECHMQRDGAIARAEKAERERDEARADRNDALDREKAEQDRAVRAERSRDLALARADRAECHDCVSDEAPSPLSPREHLANLWETAHRPVNGRIPAGTAIITRSDYGNGDVRYQTLEATGRDLPDEGRTLENNYPYGPENGTECRLLDAPEPTKPESEKPVVTDQMVERAMDRFCELDSDGERSIWDCIEGALTAALAEDGAA